MFALASCYVAMLLVGWDLAGGQGEYSMDRGWGRWVGEWAGARSCWLVALRLAAARAAACAADARCPLPTPRRPSSPARRSTWVKIAAAWLCCALYTWTLVAHRVLRNRNF